ncbi:MFS transporter [Streptomyces sp. NPDC004284]|uniref:MFS transporter n=1 Tax=Streptomyces sp. NPDC004284 TaxID=3364695 RepID=UPI00369604AC
MTTTKDRKFGGLFRDPSFRNLWVGQTAAMFGSRVVAVTVPLIAALTLNASLFEMGLITALESLPYLFISLFAGVWLDRGSKRLILVATDVVRAGLLLLIPLAWWQDLLSIPLLMGVVLLVGCCSVVSDIGGMSMLPEVVERTHLVEANSKLELSSSASSLSGSAIGGAILQVVSAPVAMVVNAATYLLSAVFTALVRTRPGAVKDQEAPSKGVWREIGEGITFITRNPTIRVLVVATMIFNFFTLALEPVFLVFITRTLDLEPIHIGLIMSSSGAGALVGALIAERFGRRLGLGPALVTSLGTAGLVSVLLPLATVVPTFPAVVLVIVMHFVDAAMVIVCNVNLRSYRTAITPDELQGRMNASNRMLVMGAAPVGAVFGGALGGWTGVTVALVVVSVGILCSAAVIFFSRVRSVREIPQDAELEAAA